MTGNRADHLADVLILQGPSIPDKPSLLSSFLQVKLSSVDDTSSIIDCQQFYTENTDCGLRDIALKIVGLLKKKRRVTVIDEFRLKVTRKSLVDTVMKKVPNCRILLIQLIPKHGFTQVMWAHQQTCRHPERSGCFTTQVEAPLKLWFDSPLKQIDYTSGYVSKPCEEEGYSIHTLHFPLQLKTAHQLELPALILQWHAEEMATRAGEMRSELMQACSTWASQNPFGRIIFLLDRKDRFEGSQELLTVKTCLKQLSVKTDRPVYAVRVTEPGAAGQFCVPPQPGLVAFLQQRHCLDLLHNNSCLIFKDTEYRKMAERSGLQYVQISSIWKNPAAMSGSLGTRPPVPDILLDMTVVTENTASDVRTLPLFEMKHLSKDGGVSQTLDNGLEEMVLFSDMGIFDRHQDAYACAPTLVFRPQPSLHALGEHSKTDDGEATHDKQNVHPSGKAKQRTQGKSLVRPSWMAKRPRRESSESSDARLSMDRSDSSDAPYSRSSKTLYLMSQRELLAMAHQVMKQAGCDLPETDQPD